MAKERLPDQPRGGVLQAAYHVLLIPTFFRIEIEQRLCIFACRGSSGDPATAITTTPEPTRLAISNAIISSTRVIPRLRGG